MFGQCEHVVFRHHPRDSDVLHFEIVDDLTELSEQNDRHAGHFRMNDPVRVDPIHDRHRKIKDNEIGLAQPRFLDCLQPVDRFLAHLKGFVVRKLLQRVLRIRALSSATINRMRRREAVPGIGHHS